MSYATIALHLDARAGMDARIDETARLARRHESHLVGLSAADHSLFGLGVVTGSAGSPSRTHGVQECMAAANDRASHFSERMRMRTEPVSFESCVDERDDVTALLHRSTCCDLVVLGQPDPAWPSFARWRDQVEQVILQSVAPTLLLPVAGRQSLAAANVMIAWDGSHAAARAVAGALPLLRRAARVQLVRCDTAVEVDRGVETSGFDLPREWLGRHGVRIEALLDRSGNDVGSSLLSHAEAGGVDLMVMGAWGMPRWAERLVGGTTRTLLSDMNVPILMSH